MEIQLWLGLLGVGLVVLAACWVLLSEAWEGSDRFRRAVRLAVNWSLATVLAPAYLPIQVGLVIYEDREDVVNWHLVALLPVLGPMFLPAALWVYLVKNRKERDELLSGREWIWSWGTRHEPSGG